MAETLSVSKGLFSFSDYKTINAAIDAAQSGDTIRINKGIYTEDIKTNKRLTFVGEGDVEINGNIHVSRHVTLSNLNVGNVTGKKAKVELYNCCITGDLILQDSSNLIVDGTTVIPDKSILIKNHSQATIKNSIIKDSKGNGISIKNQCDVTIENCKIFNHPHQNILIEASKVKMMNTESYNSKQNGVWAYNGSDIIIQDCKMFNNYYPNIGVSHSEASIVGTESFGSKENGIWVVGGKAVVKKSSISANEKSNILCDNAEIIIDECRIFKSKETGILIEKSSIATIQHSKVFNNKFVNIAIFGAKGTIIHSESFGSKREGIWIKENGEAKVEACKVFNNENDNIVVQNARAEILNTESFESRVGGILVTEEGKVTVGSSIISNNRKFNVDCNKSHMTMTGCEISDSAQTGVVITSNSRMTIQECKIFNNGFSNIIAVDSIVDLSQSTSYGSKQTGIWINQSSEATMENCEIFDNDYPNILVQNAKAKIFNTKSYGSAQFGMWVKENGKALIQDSTISNNRDTGLKIESGGVVESNHLKVENNQHGNIVEAGGSYRDLGGAPRTRRQSTTVPSPIVHNTKRELQSLAELEELIGLSNVKTNIYDIIDKIELQKELEQHGLMTGQGFSIGHTVLYGNPGTGKTTVAKILGGIYKELGFLEKGHVVQVNREKLVAQYIGQTAVKTQQKIEEAMGGVLFIDEAYALTNKGFERDFGLEAIEVLLEAMENNRGKFVVIAAGYQKEMQQFLSSNPGLQSRFTQFFELEDYTPEEMLEIAISLIQKNHRILQQEAKERLLFHFTNLWRKRDDSFSNARLVRNYVDMIMDAQMKRFKAFTGQRTKEFLQTIVVDDIDIVFKPKEKKAFDVPINEPLLHDTLQQLQDMVGLESVKAEIEKIVKLARYYKEIEKGLGDLANHIILTGAPGTGKTEMARIIAKIYQALGIVERGELIEVSRDLLVGIYQGETEEKVRKVIEKAMGGILFIDEAYQLTQYGTNDLGHRVIEVLLKYMEDRRGEFIVIAAGYPDKMKEFLGSNEGLGRRFTRQLYFEDYKPIQLVEIMEYMVQVEDYQLSEDAKVFMLDYFTELYNQRNQTFGNAGLVRNIAKEAIKQLDYRIASLSQEQRKQLNRCLIMVEDIQIPV